MITQPRFTRFRFHLVLQIGIALLTCSSTTMKAAPTLNSTNFHDQNIRMVPGGTLVNTTSQLSEERGLMSELTSIGEKLLPGIFTEKKVKAAESHFDSYDFTQRDSNFFLLPRFTELAHTVRKMFKNSDVGYRVLYTKFASVYDARKLAKLIQESKDSSEIARKFESIQMAE
ncbi:RxLR-like protein [Plasmopara halstedii]|uniref:RxLR-like protein n=1 Tax=Plasmopara halstedii TaxID=4781 RepID=A0A0P1AQS9_PLAHL|nr:RxLR-like protein [Plasmopara halstedii]CEG43561.1 RxLR-like protein [Plasmopara halstedii]|eukprot:XP_024579930.1 RxLR-like protein [Plasmopara halstedii]